MAAKLPYVAQPTGMLKIFEKIRHAKTPDQFTHDFLRTTLGFKGGNYAQFISLAKKLGFLGSDGRPSDIYKKFRNEATAKEAMAQGIKNGFQELFSRNEKVYSLDKAALKGLIVEITGLDSKNRVVALIYQTFETLKTLADFKATLPADGEGADDSPKIPPSDHPDEPLEKPKGRDFDLNLSYTINLVLPKTDDPAVFTAIFRSLREHLLRK